MDRNTLYAIALSVVFIGAVLYISDYLNPKAKPQNITKQPIANGKGKEKKKETSDNDKNKTKISSNPDQEAKKSPQPDVDFKGRTHPLKQYNALLVKDKAKTKPFEIETEVFKVQFTPIDAGLNSLKLVKYHGKPILDEKGKTVGYEKIEAVFTKDKKKVMPLATSFVKAENLESKLKLKTLYQYAVYEYMEKTNRLTVTNPGTIGANSTNYNKTVLENIQKLKIQHQTKGKTDKKISVALFFAEFYVKSSKEPKKIQMIKMFTFHDDKYLFDVNTKIISQSDEHLLIGSNDPGTSKASFYIHWGKSLGPHYVKNDDTSRYDDVIEAAHLVSSAKTTEEKLATESKSGIRDFRWLSLDSRYLLVSMTPGWNVKNNVKVWNRDDYFGEVVAGEKVKKVNGEIIGIGFEKTELAKKNDSKDFHLSILISPKSRRLLGAYEDFDFIKVRNRSSFSFILQPLEWAVEWLLFFFHDWVLADFGMSIIFLTVVLKIVLHPLTKKSLESSRKMSELQPKMKEIEAKYKKNPQEKQKAIMAMYKKEGVNPLGGCLPLILQMPVFFALWAVLPSLLELKNADFLWIQDLSSPDLTWAINLGITNSLNVLPLIMTATSVLQMKLSPQPSMGGDDKAQTAKMMQYMMPIIFLFIFWTMPSGLVLYWTVQNSLQIGQQLLTNYMGKRKPKKT